jgi:hypothetical protein
MPIAYLFLVQHGVFGPSISHIGKCTCIQQIIHNLYHPIPIDFSRNCISYYLKSTKYIHFYHFNKLSNTIYVPYYLCAIQRFLSQAQSTRIPLHKISQEEKKHCKTNKLIKRECKIKKRNLPESPTIRTRTWPQGGPPFWSLFSLSRSLQNIVVMFFVLQNKSKSLLQNRTSKRSPIKHTQSQQRTTNSPNGYPQIQIHISSTFQAA